MPAFGYNVNGEMRVAFRPDSLRHTTSSQRLELCMAIINTSKGLGTSSKFLCIWSKKSVALRSGYTSLALGQSTKFDARAATKLHSSNCPFGMFGRSPKLAMSVSFFACMLRGLSRGKLILSVFIANLNSSSITDKFRLWAVSCRTKLRLTRHNRLNQRLVLQTWIIHGQQHINALLMLTQTIEPGTPCFRIGSPYVANDSRSSPQ